MRASWLWLLLSALILAGCAQEPDATPRCALAPEIDASPNSLLAVFELIDALPKPVTVACFVESLERPLTVIGSTNDFSFQPAEPDSPRVLLLLDQLVVSWVPAGDGSDRLEFAEERPDGRSVKAELLMPVQGPITEDNFEHVLHEGRRSTVCSGCHFGEEPVDLGFGQFFESDALQVAPDEVVRVPHFRSLYEACDPEDDARRCDIFNAMFEHGEVRDGDFPEDLPTIYD